MTEIERPWSVPLRFNEVGREPVRRQLEADAPTRERIARFLDLEAVERLVSDLTISPEGDFGVRVEGRLDAGVVYTCSVTAESLPEDIATDFSVVCLPADKAPEPAESELEIDPEGEDPPDLVEGGAIDLAGYVVEHLALELDPFPRKPGAVFEPPAEAQEESPFAKLATLKPRASD